MVFSLSSQSILRVAFSLILVTYLVSAHLMSMYRKIMQAKVMILERLSELKSVEEDEIVQKMIADLLMKQIVYYQSLLTSVPGTILRKIHLVKANDDSLLQMVKEYDSVHRY